MHNDDQSWRFERLSHYQSLQPKWYDISDKEVAKELKKRGLGVEDIPEKYIFYGHVATEDLEDLISRGKG